MKCDAKTFAGMYEAVYKDMYRFALCMMKNPHDAEDAVSDAVVNAYGHISSLRSREAFKSWIFAILSNICKKKLSANAKQQKQEAGSFFGQEELHIPVEEEDFSLSMDLRKAFSILSEEEQLIVGLSVYGGYQSSEIGQMINMNANTVRSRRKRALEKMSVVLDW